MLPVDPPPMPRALRGVVLVGSAGVLLSAAAGVYVTLSADPSPQWGTFGYEVVIAASAVFGVLLGLGRFRAGSGLCAGLVALAWFVGTGMGRLPFHSSPRGVVTDPWFVGRAAAAAMVAGSGALAVLARDARAWRRLIVGGMLLAPVGAFVVYWFGMGGGWLGSTQTGAAEVIKNCVLFVVVLVLGGLFCFGADAVIRAFGYGVPAGQPGAPESATAKGADRVSE
ncbi:MAG: hypothetical protein KF705_01315 [Phycisphaeraceae bacterium]|nr:hypothetical protein [Phycisphaeraceae bacterium]